MAWQSQKKTWRQCQIQICFKWRHSTRQRLFTPERIHFQRQVCSVTPVQ
ncbi:uncharacterized protein ACO6RY_10491 [Pungitius sinensis]